MESSEEKPVLKCDNLLVSPRGIAEVHGKKIVIFVPATDIGHVTLKFGRSDHRPVVSLSIGILMALVGLFGLIEFVFINMRGYRYEIGMMLFGAIGGSIIFDTLKERYFLEIDSKAGPRRLVFSKQVQRKDIDEFCNKVRTVYNYQITDGI